MNDRRRGGRGWSAVGCVAAMFVGMFGVAIVAGLGRGAWITAQKAESPVLAFVCIVLLLGAVVYLAAQLMDGRPR